MDIRNAIRSLLSGDALESCIDPEERVVFFPTAAHFCQRRRCWEMPIHGWIYQPTELSRIRRTGLKLLRGILQRRIGPDAGAREIFSQRAGAFLADNERWERVRVRVGAATFVMKRSHANGHFEGTVTLCEEEAAVCAAEADGASEGAAAGQREPGARWLSFRAITRSTDARVFGGRVLLVPAEGMSVISDIDDTIKVTAVRDRRQMLRNTFLKEFASVPEMAALYRRWAAEGAAFHYVSASPWHLYPFLAEFMQGQGFPEGTFHLRDFRLVPGSLHHSLRPSQRVKLNHARGLLKRFAQRKFVLVGDSGESDAGMYARIYQEFPGQVEKILIRDSGTGLTAEQERALRNVPVDRWRVFRQAGELA